MATARALEVRRRRHRQEKLEKLRQKYSQARNEEEKTKIFEKVMRLTKCSINEREFMAPLSVKPPQA